MRTLNRYLYALDRFIDVFPATANLLICGKSGVGQKRGGWASTWKHSLAYEFTGSCQQSINLISRYVLDAMKISQGQG
jgi:hypothetical protein